MAAILEPGDDVLIEQPAYGPILDVARYLDTNLIRYPRRPENGFAIDPGDVRRAVTPRTKLILLTNLHNPTSVLTPDAVLQEIGAIGPQVLVDEVYLDAVYEGTPRSAFHLGENFITTNSLTKVYGVSGLRCGWILARPELATKMRLLNDVYAATTPYHCEVLSVAAFEHLDRLRERARKVVQADRKALAASHIPSVPTEWGTTAFVKFSGDESLFQTLREQYETSVVPGRFFEMPEYFRIGMGVNSEMFAEGVRRLVSALPARLASL